MYLHFIPDNRFINTYIAIAEEVAPNKNIFLINKKVTNGVTKNIKYKNTIHINYALNSIEKQLGDLCRFEKIFIHFLSPEIIDIINRKVTYKGKYYWFFWGADFYTPFNYFKNDLYDEESLKYFNKYNTFITSKSKLTNSIKLIKRQTLDRLTEGSIIRDKVKAIKRIDYLCHFSKDDYEFIKSTTNSKIAYLPFFYFEYDYSTMFTINNSGSSPINIQLGNSASLSNNHISALNNLLKIRNNIKIICPLSYGDIRYASYVVSLGKKLFGENFTAVNTYLPPQKYANMLANVNVSYMNHIRSEGAGNTFMNIASGKTTILNPKSNVYKFLKDLSIKTLNSTELSITSTLILPDDILEKNADILSKHFSYPNAVKNYEAILKS